MDDGSARIPPELSVDMGAATRSHPVDGNGALPMPCSNHLNSEIVDEQIAYWTRKLAAMPALPQLLTDRQRPKSSSHACDSVQFRLSSALGSGLRKLARQQQVSLLATLLSGWALMLSRWSGQEEILIGLRVVNHRRLGTEPLIGVFQNTLALRISLHDDPTVERLLKQVDVTAQEAQAHRDVPFEQVGAALGFPDTALPMLMEFKDTARTPNATEPWRGELKLDEPSIQKAKASFELALSLNDIDGYVRCALQYASDLFERATIERIVACWETLLKGMVKHVKRPSSRITMLTSAERERVLYGFNETEAGYPQNRVIHQLFEEQVQRTPDAIAVEYEGQRLTYAELNSRANQLARYLKDRNVRPDHLVALFVERSPELVVGMLGILKAGGAYMPLDPLYPAKRLAYMIEDAKPRILLTQKHLRSALPKGAITEVIDIDGDWAKIAKYEDANLPPSALGLASDHLAYVIYTSGSTGTPKGAMNEHCGMVNRIIAQKDIEGFSEGDICCQKTSISFVDAVFEIFGALCTGRPLVIIPAAAANDPEEMAALIARQGVTRLTTVPSLARSMLESPRIMRDLSGLRSWTLSGEEVRSDLLMKLQRELPKCEFIIQYGSSEVSSDAAIFKSRSFDGERVPLGRPLPNVQIYILDRHGEPVPTGVAGEIHVGGVGVGRGYFKRPDLTAARFSTNRFSSRSEARLYKTGDLGRWRSGGVLEYLGRNDDQVKIRGFRIELGEVEAHLLRQHQVREAVVIVREDVPGDKRLVAYVTLRGESSRDEAAPARDDMPKEAPAAEATEPHASPQSTLEVLRSHLKSVLPDYMVPRAFVLLKAMPLTPNGKLDRRALPAPAIDAYATRQFEAPRGVIELTLTQIWQELLHVDRVGRQDNFFELGGHSLLIVQMMERLRRAGLSAQVSSIFGSTTLADLAQALGRVSQAEQVEVPPNRIPPSCDAITPQMLPLVDLEPEHIERIARSVPGGVRNIQDIYPLAPLQEGLLFHHLLDEHGGDTYVEATLLKVSTRSRLEQLVAALQGVIDRHDILRTAIFWEQLPRPVQVAYRRVTLPVEEITLDRDRDLAEQLEEWMRPELQRMNLRQAPLMRLQIAADSHSTQWYVRFQLHHIIDDDASLKILISEVVSHLEGRAGELPEPVAYRNHVAQVLEHARLYDAEAFFRSKLNQIEEPTALFGLLEVHADGSRIDEARQELDPALAKRTRLQAQRLGMSVATLFHAAWALVAARTSGREDVVFGTVLLGRLQGDAGAQRVVGMFINTLPIGLQLGEVTARQLVDQTQRELVQLLTYEQASLSTAQRCSGIAGSAPLFNAVLNYRHSAVVPAAEWASAPGVHVLMHRERTNYPITVSIDDLGEGFTLTAQTDRQVEPQRVLGYVSEAMRSLIGALEQAPQTSALSLSILPESERRKVLELFNATHASYPEDKLINELFEQQVKQNPDATAVIYEEQSLTYAELNGRANQLARYLILRDVQIGEHVPVLMTRCLDMLIAQLAVLKSGAVYVPMDPELPPERQAFMIRDCGARRVIMRQTASAGMGLESLEWIDMAQIASATELLPEDDIGLRVAKPAPVYVMYTSGSTGVPKGVVIPHHAVNRLVINNGYAEIGPSDCIAHGSNPAFDASTLEIWGALLNGARVLIVPQSVVLSSRRFAELLVQQKVSVLWLTIGLFRQYAELMGQAFSRLRYLLTGGDVVEPAVVRRLLQRSPPRHLLSAYGPTECTTFSTTYLISSIDESAKSIPIGRPISNTKIYILDRDQQPVPIGVAGEIYIGGSGVAMGYLNRPELTAQRFIADPFSADPLARLYKSGDLGRWRADGNVEFLGRNDSQVKLRGFRLELEEIEAHLLLHPQIKEAVVLAREDEPGDKRLAAYIVADFQRERALAKQDSEEAAVEVVDQWKLLYEETYSADARGPSFVGWNSSYTGQPIPEEQMQEWLACTLERIRALRPQKILEIGCGVGLLLQHLAPESSVYVGTDFSDAALSRLRQWIKGCPDLGHVQLLHRTATELQDLLPGHFDTIVINSVVQYFPDIEYLLAVLKGAVRLLGPGGKIFIGDVRNLALLPMFHSAVQLSRVGAAITVGQLKRRVARAAAQDKEMVIDPQFFEALPGRLPGICSVDVQLKRGRAPNELTRYRYDAVLHVGDELDDHALYEPTSWQVAVGSKEEFVAALAERRWPSVRLHSIPNARLSREAAIQRLIETSDERTEASALRLQLKELPFDGVDPESLCELAQAQGYVVEVNWDDEVPSHFQMRLSYADQVPRGKPRQPDATKAWSAYANDPLESGFRQQLIPRLREHLKGRLPEYMIPSTWMVLKQLPLTSNGKVDRRALPAPHSRPEEMGEYIPPSTEIERSLAEIWAQVLRVDQVGVQDNFFELGGHSLLATQVAARIGAVLSIEIPVRLLFDCATIERLSVRVDELRQTHLLEEIADRGKGMEYLVERVASMSASEVQKLMNELRKDAHG